MIERLDVDLLIVAEDDALLEALSRAARLSALTVDVAGTYAEALRLLARNSYDVAAVDAPLRDGTGLALLEHLHHQERPAGYSVIVTGVQPSALADLIGRCRLTMLMTIPWTWTCLRTSS